MKVGHPLDIKAETKPYFLPVISKKATVYLTCLAEVSISFLTVFIDLSGIQLPNPYTLFPSIAHLFSSVTLNTSLTLLTLLTLLKMTEQVDVIIWTSTAPVFKDNYDTFKKSILELDGKCEEPNCTLHPFSINTRPNREFQIGLVDQIIKRIRETPLPSISVILLGTQEAMQATEEEHKQDPEKELPSHDANMAGLVRALVQLNKTTLLGQTEQAHNRRRSVHGLLFVTPFPLNMPEEGEPAFPLDKYDEKVGRWSYTWEKIVKENIDSSIICRVLDPSDIFCDKDGVLSTLAHEKDGVSLTPEGVYYVAERIQTEVHLLHKEMQLVTSARDMFSVKLANLAALKSINSQISEVDEVDEGDSPHFRPATEEELSP